MDGRTTDHLEKLSPGPGWNLNLNGPLTLVAWLNISGISAEPMLMGSSRATYGLDIYSGGVATFAGGPPGTANGSGYTIPSQNVYHQIAGTWDGTTNANGLKIYIDGVLGSSGQANTNGIGNISKFMVAFDPPYYLSAVYDEMRVYNTELSGAELLALTPEIVPEPSTMMLLGAGGVLLLRRRQTS